MNFSLLIDTQPDGRCRAHDIVTGKVRWFDDLTECRDFLRWLDAQRREVPGFGMLTEAQKAKKQARTRRKPKKDPSPWMDPNASQTALF